MDAHIYVCIIQIKGEDYLRGRPEVVYSKLETANEVALAWGSEFGVRFTEEPQTNDPGRTRIEGNMTLDGEGPATLYVDVYKIQGASIA